MLASSLGWEEGSRYVRLAFKATLDEFARLEINRAWTPVDGAVQGAAQLLNSTEIALSVQSEGTASL